MKRGEERRKLGKPKDRSGTHTKAWDPGTSSPPELSRPYHYSVMLASLVSKQPLNGSKSSSFAYRTSAVFLP